MAGMDLIGDEELERSSVVANCRMNRERGLVGSNGYAVEIGLDPLDFLRERVAARGTSTWLDLCCGSGKALIEAARIVHDDCKAPKIEIVGVDLVRMFHRPDTGLGCLHLVEASLSTWHPGRRFDLISCVHGLHYVGDKLGLIARAASWLTDDGMFVASLDLDNLKLADGKLAGRRVASELRRSGVVYDPRKRLVVCRGNKELGLPFIYLGASDQAGPNYTGQPAVDSHYLHDLPR